MIYGIVIDNPERASIYRDIEDERARQDAKWEEQNHPDGTGLDRQDRVEADLARALCDEATQEGRLTWKHILREEVLEAFAESDPDLLDKELTEVIAVAVAWKECIRHRKEQANG